MTEPTTSVSPTAVGRPSLSRPRLVLIALGFITLLVYLPVVFHDWIFFDDPAYVLDNSVVQKGITWAGMKWAFVGWHASNWHPLTWLSHMLDCQLFGLNPGAQHLVNVLFHAGNAMLLCLLLFRLTNKLWPAALVAALFAWHPLHVQSVAWISERKDVLSTFFGLLTLLAYAEQVKVHPSSPAVAGFDATRSSKFKVWALVFFALGLMAKPMLVTLPFVMLLMDYWPLRRMEEGQSGGIRHFPMLALEKWPFFVLAAISCVITVLAQRQEAVASLKQFPLGFRMENATVAYARYLLKIVWPARLAVFYPPPEHIAAGHVVVAAMVLLAISALAWRWRATNPCVLMGWLWFVGTLVPVIGLVQVGEQAMADRYTYLPSIGLFIAIVFGSAAFTPLQRSSGTEFQNDPTPPSLATAKRAEARAPLQAFKIATPVILLGCIAATEYQLTFWRNTGRLFEHALAVTSDNGPAHMMLGVWFERQGQPGRALEEYQRALDRDTALVAQVSGGEKRPLAAQVQLLMGQSAEQNGNPEEALAHYRKALQLDSTLVEAYNNLGNVMDEQGRPDDALASYQSAARLQPESPLVRENLGAELVKLGRFSEGMREYETAERLAPRDSRPLYLVGKAWLRQGESASAVNAFEMALDVNPNDVQSLTFLARVLAADENPQVRNGDRAVEAAKWANDITEGKQPFVLGSLAMAYAEVGRFDDARQTARHALALTPTNTETFSNLQAQLALYQANQPYREKFSSTR